ncbi:acyltransferase family protein [Bradyrhizobium sp. STM 3566]|uniref:acyltransferase family protein n=1 Tax=Bradyrhizobium sp. STM 3566 TaxID=578928 RepID=UPI00388F53EB
MTRFHSFDGMRGLAAIAVCVYHATSSQIMPGGYLAVDFFFILSGFVLARAYEFDLKTKRYGVGSFMLMRWLRLYPMFFLGLVLASAKAAAFAVYGREASLTWTQLLLALPSELLMLPSPVNGHDLYPLNGPSWSLFFELLINLVFAAWLFRQGTRTLLAIAACASVFLVTSAMARGSLDGGWTWPFIWMGAARVTFGFIVGVLISRSSLKAKPSTFACALGALALVAVLAVPVSESLRPLYDCAAVLIGFPFLVIWGASLQPPTRIQTACAALGALSYPLYATHLPLVVFARIAVYFAVPIAIWLPVFCLAICALALWLGRTVDPRLRRLLNAWRPT